MTAMLKAVNLEGGYGLTKVLFGLDFEVGQGGIATILGANGAGKTTTLRAICGMIKTTGELHFDGKRIDGQQTESIVRLGIAHVPDGRGTFASLSVEENLRLGAYVRRDRKAVEEDFERVYGHFPVLKQRFRQQAGTLSGGEQQMLALGRALMLRPRLLLMDEPSFGLAPLIVRNLFDIMRSINETENTSMLIVEQDAAAALDLADHAYLLETGKVVISGPADELKGDDAIRRAYLGY